MWVFCVDFVKASWVWSKISFLSNQTPKNHKSKIHKTAEKKNTNLQNIKQSSDLMKPTKEITNPWKPTKEITFCSSSMSSKEILMPQPSSRVLTHSIWRRLHSNNPFHLLHQINPRRQNQKLERERIDWEGGRERESAEIWMMKER